MPIKAALKIIPTINLSANPNASFQYNIRKYPGIINNQNKDSNMLNKILKSSLKNAILKISNANRNRMPIYPTSFKSKIFFLNAISLHLIIF